MIHSQQKGLRIGIDASNLRRGGGVTHLVEILAAVIPEEHNISQITVWGGQETLEQINSQHWLRLIHQPDVNRAYWRRLFWQSRTNTQESKKHADILFVPGSLYLGGFRPFVTMSRNMLPFDPVERKRFGFSPARVRYHLLEFSQARTFSRAAGVIFLTETHRRQVLDRLPVPPAETTVIPHGSSEKFDHKPSKARPLSDFSDYRPFRWLYVSIVNWYKHQWHVAEAIALLRKQGMPIALDLVGPAYQPALKKLNKSLAQLDPEGCFIRYHGAASFSLLQKFYQQADSFVFASSCETFGQILTEAMRSGLPIACADRSVMPDVLQDAGVYFDPEDPKSIASAMRILMTNHKMREQFALNAYARAKTFTWEQCARDTFSFITTVAEKYHNALIS